MDKLVALPVKGESYLLKRDGQSILVDGGYNSIGLRAAIREIDSALDRIDVVVCTHADRDHAGGLVDISDHISIREFWLPGEWGPVASRLLSNPAVVLREVIAELERRSAEHGHRDIEQSSDQEEEPLERLARQERAERPRERLYEEPAENKRSIEDSNGDRPEPREARREHSGLTIADVAPRETARKTFLSARRKVARMMRRDKVDVRLAKHWLSMINTAERIRAIAANAIAHGSRLRWFDFGPVRHGRRPSGGEPGTLVPLNAVELKSWPTFVGLSYLALLTPVNEESLVFFAPPDCEHLGVLFCADSPLGTGIGYANSFLALSASPSWGIIATAPHHGSESNKVAYEHVSKWARVAGWLRAGGSKLHPGPTFRGLPSEIRACTHCPHRSKDRRATTISLVMTWADWERRLTVHSHVCDC